ncbi:MAG: hypothetical protein NTV80_25875, partial [Verrucomicrobia bacterium]|nr:hypothetical protein [Verrucomicrobiota bacterium]
RRVLFRLRLRDDVPARHKASSPCKTTTCRRTNSMITPRTFSNTGQDRSAESCPRGEKKRSTRHLWPSPHSQNAATPATRPPSKDRIGQRATSQRPQSRNTARVDQAPSKNRGKAFPTG